MLKIKKQISRLYVSTLLENLSLTGAWVAILAARGYGLVEIGFAETVFHITSLILEIPSGILADVFGRKNMLIVSSVMRMIGNVIMIFSCNLFMICTSLAFYAAGCNFLSGSGDALAYDSLKIADNEGYYERYASNQMILYRLCSGISTMCAGLALLIGYQAAYSTDILVGAIQIWVLASLCEVRAGRPEGEFKKSIPGSVRKEIVSCFFKSYSFLKNARKAIFFMFANSLVGAVDILLLFFLQAKLPEAGIFLVLCGVLAEHSGMYLIMVIGGFIAALSDDALQVRTNRILQDMFPSEQRATLISMESFTFSVIMIVLSPLAGILFSHW